MRLLFIFPFHLGLFTFLPMGQAQLHIFHRIIIILSSAVRLVFHVLGRIFGLSLNKAKSHVNVELYVRFFVLL